MAEKQSIKRFIVRDPHGHIEQEDSFSVVGEVHVDIVPGYGEPYADSEYVNGILTITIHNIEGNGITEISTDSQEGDEAVNTVTVKTNANPEGVTLQVRNGSRGNGIASSSEVLSPEDGGTNTHTITDTDGNEHVFHTKNGQTGRKGDQGDSAIWTGEGEPWSGLKNTTGQSTTEPMTQKAVTDALDGINVAATLSLNVQDGYYYNSNGAKVSNSSSSYTDDIDLSAYKGKKLRISIPSDYSSDVRNSILKDAQGNIIRAIESSEIINAGYVLVVSNIINTGYTIAFSWAKSKTIKADIVECDVSDIYDDVLTVGELSGKVDDLHNFVDGSTDFDIPVVQNTYLSYRYNISIPKETKYSITLHQNNVLDANGTNLFVKYSDNTESTAYPFKVGASITRTEAKDIIGFAFTRGASGAIATGNAPVTVQLADSMTMQIAAIESTISAITNAIMYIKPDGDDTKDGLTPANAKATINAALTAGAETIMMDGGEYEMSIDLTKTSRPHISIKGLTGKKVIIKAPNSVLLNDGSEEAVDGHTSVYKMALATAPGDGIKLFFDGLNDAETSITNSERRPEQGGKFYRCDCTQVIKSTAESLNDALDDIEESTTFKWYHSDGYLYFKRSESDTSVYPLVKPINTTHITYGSSDWRPIDLEITNVEFRYAVLKLERFQNARLCCVASKYVYGSGAFVYDKCINVVFDHCEAARCFSGQYGDGFNAHATSSDAGSKGTYATLINCWSHDNTDDGYSDHEYSETMIIGGLFEYNGKAGVTPSFGSHLSAHDVYSRHNYCGFYYIGGAQDGGNGGQMVLYNCISDSNTAGGNLCGFHTDSTSQAILYNCVAMNETTGYKTSNTSTMQLIDCKAVNCTTAKAGSGITVVASTNLT